MKSTEDVLERNNLVYKVLPPRWVFGLPIGNGQIGGMVWVEDETKIVVTLDSVWAWDHRQRPMEELGRHNYARLRELLAVGNIDEIEREIPNFGFPSPRKTYVGRLVIDVGEQIVGEACLCLRDASVALEVKTNCGEEIHLKFVAYANQPAIAIDHSPRSAINEVRLERLPAHRIGTNAIPDYRMNGIPDSALGTSDTIEWIRQDIPDSPSIVLALLPGGTQSFVTVQVARDENDPIEEAVRVLEATAANPGAHLEGHCTWWRCFWDKSSIQLPDEKIEALWYLGLYMLASASREGGFAASLHGLWSPDSRLPPAGGFYIWDFYSQHWGLYTANHLEIGDVFCDHFISIVPRLKEQTRLFYGWDGVFVPGTMIVDGSWIRARHKYNKVVLWPGTTAWVAQAFWWQYLYNNDVVFLREKAYPFMRECMLFYERLLEKGEDGKYHLNATYSPEWEHSSDWMRDDTFSLSLVRYLIRGILRAVEILEIDEPHLAIWEDMQQHLQEYHTDNLGLCLAEGVPYRESHRHLSHLGPIYPCDDLNIDGSLEDCKLIEDSISTVIHKGYGTFVGWSFVWLSAIAAKAGLGQMAWWTLKQFAEAFVSCNTYNLNLDWERNGISVQPDGLCVDGNMGAVDAVNQMVVQSRGDRLRVFPACPNHWRDVRFENLRCEGGVLVSAVRSDGRTLGVRLVSASGGRIRLANPFDGSSGYLNRKPIKPNAEGDFLLSLTAGEEIWLTAIPAFTSADFDSFIVERPEVMRNPYGLKYFDEQWLTEGSEIPHVHPMFQFRFGENTFD